ncbi:hypothetical protein NBO_74g0004 [Nosema bombycis CQ1]|uniref:Mechanosensitive ion channel MscS domain-containing protein n=1 Tax=Nosema bombycis (strain CQ1 / CVCC 102059) TaxID=578461 RepID=R0M634_NOSB1|nr:hypothetical protein NBO_74g0004 [Nosema bombycis CQ1]|eukprot:EOB13429.1 hypothetical protein NBO_74g0004 [Nosema bombycis CQ1]
MVLPLILNIFGLGIVLCIFHISSIEIKRFLFVPIVSLSTFLWFIIYRTRENEVMNIQLKIYCRVFKFLILYILFYCLKQIMYIPYTTLFNVSVALVIVLDVLRAYIFELSKERILNRLITGLFRDMLRFKIITTFQDKQNHLQNLVGALEKFHSLGPPVKLNADELFPLWSNKPVEFPDLETALNSSIEENELASSLGRESVRDTVSYNRAIIRHGHSSRLIKEDIMKEMRTSARFEAELNSLVPPEIFKFRHHDPQAIETMPPDYPEDLADSDEKTPMDEDEFEDTDLIRFDESQFQWLYLEKWKQQEEERLHGKITVESLSRIFGEVDAAAVYEVLSFKRSEDLILSIFKENIRQINNEQENLYNATDSSIALIRIIYWTCIGIESLFVYTLISSYLQVQPLLLKLALPIFIVPILPSLKSILEAFFFLVFSHPYDAGDRVFIDGQNYIVRNISMFSTTLIRWDGMRCSIPNNQIKDKVLINVRRSYNQKWRIEFLIDSRTSQRRVEYLKTLLRRYLELDGAYKSVRIDLDKVVDSSYLLLAIIVEHSSNFQNGFLMWNTHSKFIRIVNKSLYILNIKALALTKRVHIKNAKQNYEESEENYEEFEDYFISTFE